jgi:hypothetical protein
LPACAFCVYLYIYIDVGRGEIAGRHPFRANSARRRLNIRKRHTRKQKKNTKNGEKWEGLAHSATPSCHWHTATHPTEKIFQIERFPPRSSSTTSACRCDCVSGGWPKHRLAERSSLHGVELVFRVVFRNEMYMTIIFLFFFFFGCRI